jgi:hypothetical protein
MNKLTKLLVLSSIASATLFANDNLVIDFEKKRLSQNPNVKASNIKIFYKKELEAKGWYGYILDFDAWGHNGLSTPSPKRPLEFPLRV